MLFLDITLDKLPINPNDPLYFLKNITNKQDELIQKALKILENVRDELKE